MTPREGRPRGEESPELGPLSRLAVQAKAGDKDALEEFARSLFRYVLWAVRARMPPSLLRKFEVADLASAAWIAILENLQRLEVRSDGELRAWLRRIVSTQIVAEQRRGLVAERSLDRILESKRTPKPLQTDDAQHVADLWGRVELAQIAAALLLMPDHLAEILWIRDFDGCGPRETARLLEIPESSVRRDYGKAKARLAAILGGEAGRGR